MAINDIGNTISASSPANIALGNFSIPLLSTEFPKTAPGSKTTPVVTSKAADDHITKLGDTVTKSNQDIVAANQANIQATKDKATADAAQKQQDIVNQQNAQKNAPPKDDSTALLEALTGNLSTEAKPDATQSDVINTDTQQNQIDEQNLSTVSDAIDQMNAGSYPLSATESASVSNLKNQFTTAYQTAQDLTKNQIGGQTVLNAKSGIQMYSPTEALGKIANVIKTGNTKIAEINTKLLDAQSKLTQAFKDEDFKTATSLYNKISDTIKQRKDEIDTINKSVADTTKEMHQNALDTTKLQLDAIVHDDTVSYQEKQQAIAQSTLDEKTKNDLATQNLNLLKYQLDKSNQGTPGAVTSLPSVNMTASDVPNAKDQADFLASVPGGPTGEVATLVKGIADYSINPSSVPTRNYKGVGGLTQSQVVAMAKQYDPTFLQGDFANRQALKKRFQSGDYSQNINSLNTAIGHLTDLSSNFDKLDNTNFTPFNALNNKVKTAFGGGGVTSAGTNISAVMGELASTFKGGGATDQEIKNLGTLDVNSSPEQVKAFIETATQLLASRLDALQQTYQSGMGKAPDKSFLGTKQSDDLLNLQQKGYDIKVPELANNPTVVLKTFNDAAPENKTLLQGLHQTMPDATPDEIVNFLKDNGKLQ